MFQNIIYTIYNQSSDNKFVSEIADKCGSENDGKENQSRKFFRNRWNDIVDAENDGPDDPNRNGKRTNDYQSLYKRPKKKPKIIVKASVHRISLTMSSVLTVYCFFISVGLYDLRFIFQPFFPAFVHLFRLSDLPCKTDKSSVMIGFGNHQIIVEIS